MAPTSSFFRLIIHMLPAFGTVIGSRLARSLYSIIHRFTYKSPPTPLPLNSIEIHNVVIIGGSFAGVALALQLTHLLPTHYRVLLVEPHSHLHFAFAFPRLAAKDNEELARKCFVPYDGMNRNAKKGIFEHVHAAVVEVLLPTLKEGGKGKGVGSVRLSTGVTVPYAFLVFATGSAQPLPARLDVPWTSSSEVSPSISADVSFSFPIPAPTHPSTPLSILSSLQALIASPSTARIAVVGGGAVGCELAIEIGEFFPEKEVVLIHSRERLLHRFGEAVGVKVEEVLKEAGVEVWKGRRAVVVPKEKLVAGEAEEGYLKGERVRFGEREEEFDLIIPCTGLAPRSSLLASISPSSVCPTTSEILVLPTLHVSHLPNAVENIFALGDVAKTGAHKQARAALLQGDVVADNIYSLIKGRVDKLKEYKPSEFEGALILTMANKEIAYMAFGNKGEEFLRVEEKRNLDVGAGKMWRMMGVKYEGKPTK